MYRVQTKYKSRVYSSPSRSVQGVRGQAVAADVSGELCEPGKPTKRFSHLSRQDYR